MARNRMIKPSFWTSEQVVECSPNARLLFIGMWNFCDDAGIHQASLKSLKMEIFPGDDFTLDHINEMIAELMESELLIYYVVEGRGYFQVTGWHHQRIEKPSYVHPNIDKSESGSQPFDYHSTNSRRPFSLKRREEKRREEKTDDSAESTSFEDFWKSVTATWHGKPGTKAEAKREFENINPSQEVIQLMLAANRAQYDEAKQAEANKQFAPNFKHVCRWLKYRGWEESKPSATVHPFTRNPNYPHLVKPAQELGESVDYEFGGELLFISGDGRIS
jgi:hypothetical protein